MDSFQELLNKKEPLRKELMKYKGELKGMPVVRHPLVYSVPHDESFNALLNKRYELIKAECEKALAKKDYGKYIFWHERPYRLDAFMEKMNFLTDRKYWKILGEIWVDSENIWQNLPKWKKLLKAERSSKYLFMEGDDYKMFKTLPERITAYRGYVPNQNENEISYTLEKENAEWFAKRYWKKNGQIKELSVPKEKIFAYINTRTEKEVIII